MGRGVPGRCRKSIRNNHDTTGIRQIRCLIAVNLYQLGVYPVFFEFFKKTLTDT